MDGDSGDDDDATVMVMVLARRMGLVFRSGRFVACPSTPASAQAPDAGQQSSHAKRPLAVHCSNSIAANQPRSRASTVDKVLTFCYRYLYMYLSF